MVTANYYGNIRLLCLDVEGYVLSDGTACLSELGAAKLLGFNFRSGLNRMYTNSWSKELEPFVDKEIECTQTLVKVMADCPHKGIEIKVYTAMAINAIAKSYATAYLQSKLRKNQIHIGLQCATLRNALADIALEQMIYEACKYKPEKSFAQRIERCWKNHLYQELQDTLWEAIQKLYPDREDGKYRWIMANTYRWIYHLLLGEEQYKAVYTEYQKAKKQSGSRVYLHQFISDSQKREECKKLLKIFVALIQKYEDTKLPEEIRERTAEFYEIMQEVSV